MPVLLLGVMVSYLLGAIPAAYLVTKYVKRVDIRTVGSGNVGATNTLRAVGTGPAVVVLLFDLFKGLAAVVLVAPWIAQRSTVIPFAALRALCGLAAVGGHCYNVFLGMRGGKGVATGLGILFGIAPAAAVAGIGIFSVVVALTRYVSLGSLAACAAMPALLFVRQGVGYDMVLTLLVAVLIVLRHADNIRRLRQGVEKKIGQKS